jgi:nucleotide-binding universal stress UspA family protein
VDLVVAGTRGMTGLKKLVMGSVSNGLVSHAKCPVLVVR